jgi:hypothetical protein
VVTVKTDKGTYSGRTTLDAVRKGFGHRARVCLYPVAYRTSRSSVGFVEIPTGRSSRVVDKETFVFVARIIDVVR